MVKNNPFLKADTIIFDMDGTLIESMGVWNQIDRVLIEKLGGLPEDEMEIGKRRDVLLAEYSEMEDPYKEYCAFLGKLCHSSLSGEEIRNLRYTISQDFLRNRIVYKEGAAGLVKKLHALGKTLVIATTTKRSNIEIYTHENRLMMETLLLDQYFTAIYTREDVKTIKPSPEVHEKVLKDLGKRKEDCLIVEDSLSGIEAARNAGISVAAVYDRYSAPDGKRIREQADYWYDSLEEIEASLN